MIQAPSRYARLIRAFVPFAAVCGLVYLFLITFNPHRFGPTATILTEEAGEHLVVGQSDPGPESIEGVDRVLIEWPQEPEPLQQTRSTVPIGSKEHEIILDDVAGLGTPHIIQFRDPKDERERGDQGEPISDDGSAGEDLPRVSADEQSPEGREDFQGVQQVPMAPYSHDRLRDQKPQDQRHHHHRHRQQQRQQQGEYYGNSIEQNWSMEELGDSQVEPLLLDLHQQQQSNIVQHEVDSDEEYMPMDAAQDIFTDGDDTLPEEGTVYEVERANGVFVIVTHEDDLQSARETIRQVEDRFNRGRNYPWVILSPLQLTARSQNLVRQLSKGVVTFGTIPHEQWRLPRWIEAAKVRNGDYAKMKLGLNKTSLVVRHKWRFMSGYLARHELLDPYEFFWRVDPDVEIFCDVQEDPMLTMKRTGQKFAWSLSLTVNEHAVPGAWSTIQKFKREHQDLLSKANDEEFLLKETGDAITTCTYGVANSIARVDFFRSPEYLAYFYYIDREGPIYYEKWTDAFVITMGLSLLRPRTDTLFLKRLGWRQGAVGHCPANCPCDPSMNNMSLHLSCTPFWMGQANSPEIKRRLECGKDGKCIMYVKKTNSREGEK